MVIVRRSALPGPAPMGPPGSTPPGPACSGLRTRASHRSAPQRPATGPASGGPAHATGPASSGPALATGPACGGPPGSTPHVIETVWSVLAKEFRTIVCKLEGDGQSLFFTATVGSICAGMGNDNWAIVRLPWGFCHVFWCYSCPVARKSWKGNFGDVPNWSCRPVSTTQERPMRIYCVVGEYALLCVFEDLELLDSQRHPTQAKSPLHPRFQVE